MQTFVAPSVIDCSCHLSYVPDDPESAKEHAHHHAEYERIVERLGHPLDTFADREENKTRGREILRNGRNAEEKTAGGMILINGYFHRSADNASARGFGKLHITFPAYAYLAACNNILGDQATSDALKQRYAYAAGASGRLNGTDWEP